eukprot:gb/GECH01011830.1/.p1 GENE.gb/GECH01011830.1/~~gb/GECH01011830.1/.p1  ORF type:complete len:486 (+),score=121.14 gb/GECH01011830.1/:1-1458(+)
MLSVARKAPSIQASRRACSSEKPQLPNFEYEPPQFKGPSVDWMKNVRKENIMPMVTYYKDPICITDAKMQYMWDTTGKRYLDMFGGIVTVSVGHCHPQVQEALSAQSEKLWHTTSIYLHPKIHEYTEQLLDKFPEPLDSVLFVNSGSEANDLALMLARLHTGAFDFMALRNAYHGMSLGTQRLTGIHSWHFPTPMGFGTHHAMTPDGYRGAFGGNRSPYNVCERFEKQQCSCGDLSNCEAPSRYADELKASIKAESNGKIAGFIAEPIQGVGGTMQLADGYLPKAYEVVREFGGINISDEVQTGFGRLGSKMWGFQDQEVKPDMVTLAKGIGNGFPMGAVVTTKEIAQLLGQRLHFNTYGGNPLASAVGMAVLDVIEKEGLQENSAKRGDELMQGMLKLKDKYEIVGDVRGKGLMLGMEIVKDKESKTPDPQKLAEIFEKTKDMGLLIGKGGADGNVFRIKPPMCINKEDVEFTLQVLDHAIGSS